MKTLKKINWGVLIMALIAILVTVALYILGQLDVMAFKELITILGPIFVSAVPLFSGTSSPSIKSYDEMAPGATASLDSSTIDPAQKQSLLLLLARLVIGIIKVFFPTAKNGDQ